MASTSGAAPLSASREFPWTFAPASIYQASWENSFQPPLPPPLWERVSRAAIKVLSILIPVLLFAFGCNKIIASLLLASSLLVHLTNCAINRLAAAFLLPARRVPKEVREKQKAAFWKRFVPQEHQIKTPDNRAHLSAIFLRHTDATTTTPTIVFFQPNACSYYQGAFHWLVHALKDENIVVNFAFFDYRGVGSSQGKFTSPHDLKVDGACILQWLQRKMGVPAKQIFFYGRSLGGAISAISAETHPDQFTGPFISESSFATTEEVFSAHYPFLAKPLSWAMRKKGWRIDALSAVRQLKGPKLLLHHPQDSLIPFSASILQRFDDTSGSCEKVRLVSTSLSDTSLDAHNQQLNSCVVEGTLELAMDRVVDFLRTQIAKRVAQEV